MRSACVGGQACCCCRRGCCPSAPCTLARTGEDAGEQEGLARACVAGEERVAPSAHEVYDALLRACGEWHRSPSAFNVVLQLECLLAAGQ